MRDLLQTTCINRHWNTISPTFWTEVELLHRTPDNVKAKIITHSCASLKSINFIFYFDYLLAFGALRLCSRLKHLTIGEGGLTWIAGANAATHNNSNLIAPPSIATALNIPNTNGHGHANGSANSNSPSQDEDAKLLVAKATSASNMAADAANEANTAANAALNASHLAYNTLMAAAASLSPSAISPALQETLNAVTAAIESTNKAAAAAATAANAAASAANASCIATNMAGNVVRHTASHHPPPVEAVAGSSNSGTKRRRSKASPMQNGFSAKQIKTLRVTSGRADKKVIPDYKHLFMFTNLRKLFLDASISLSHLESVILAARQLHTLRINCSDSGNELHALRHAASLQTLTLEYFSPLFIGNVCNVPSLSTLNLHYTGQYQELGLQQLVTALPQLRSIDLSHPRYTIQAPVTIRDSELIQLCSLPLLEELTLQMPSCDPEIVGQLPVTSLKKLTTSMLLPMYH